MTRLLLIALISVFAGFAGAQDGASYAVEVRAGIGDIVAPPVARVQVQITRNDSRPFVGRVVVDLSSPDDMGGGPGRRRRRMMAFSDVLITQDVALEEGALQRVVTLDVPVYGGLDGEVRLEKQVSGDYFETVAATILAPATIMDERQLVGFVTDARLAEAQPWFFFQVVEIPVADMPDSWKALSAYSAIIVNDDRLSRAQSNALADYLAAGGTVILSPSSAGSFNPETLAGALLRISPTSRSKTFELSDHPALLQALKPAGATFGPVSQPGDLPPPGEEPGTEVQPEQPVGVTPPVTLITPAADSPLTLWQDGGRAKAVPSMQGLISVARVGAGNLVFVHADISREPFTTSDNVPTVPLVNLMISSVNATVGRSPASLLMEKDVRDSIDIAGHRIPGRDALVVLLLIYVSIAGVGTFLVARRIRRPELFPATLLVAAIVSVGLVFGLGEIYKRSGDRVQAVRILVSDETTDRNAVFTLGCAYSVDGDEYSFVNQNSVLMLPAGLDRPAMNSRGMPSDPLNYSTHHSAGDAETRVSELVRWQNVFFLQRDPANLENFTVNFNGQAGAWRIENGSPHELKACVLLVGQPPSAGGTLNCEWHYVSTIGASGGDDEATFSESTRVSMDVQDLAEKVADDTDDLARAVLGAMFNIDPEDRMLMALDLGQLEGTLAKGGLLPEDGEFLLMAVLPENALDPGGIGAKDVEDDDVGQVNIWMVRGAVEGR